MLHRYSENILRCPFCERQLGEPYEIKTKFSNTFSGGKCDCGAVYVYDRSGHNLGDAYVDVLTYACDEDWDKAWSLTPGEDYEIKELTYDSRRNRFHEGSGTRGRPQPAFLFVLLKTENK